MHHRPPLANAADYSRLAGPGSARESAAELRFGHVLQSAISRPRSRIGALWVIQPEEIRSTPVAAMAGAVSRVIRPEASVTARPSTIATARRRVSDVMLSSNT